jgi:predicted NAD-dependent protein-ADP-ribosyltransferase YbiA (DUF1768 family)
MKARIPNIPEIVLTLSECGTYKYFKNEKFFIIVFLATSTRKALTVTGFYQSTFSNFSGVKLAYNINGKDAIFDCGEQAFKAVCAIAHLRSKAAPTTENNLKVLKDILDASEPKEAKKAGYRIQEFDQKMWDDISPEVMYWVQLLKFKDIEFRNFGLRIAQIAKDEDVELENIFFVEAAGKDDRIWGTGPGANVDEFFEIACKEGNTEKLYNNLLDPKKRREPEDVLFVGFNGLGKAIERALCDLIGEDFHGLSESMEEFVNRINAVGGFDFFELESVEPETKRFRSASTSPTAASNISDTPVTVLTESDMPTLSANGSEEATLTSTASDGMASAPSEKMEDDASNDSEVPKCTRTLSSDV